MNVCKLCKYVVGKLECCINVQNLNKKYKAELSEETQIIRPTNSSPDISLQQHMVPMKETVLVYWSITTPELAIEIISTTLAQIIGNVGEN
jgi:hypothetical protein